MKDEDLTNEPDYGLIILNGINQIKITDPICCKTKKVKK